MPHKYAPDRKFTSPVEIIGRDLLCAEPKLVRRPERRKMCHQRMSGINSSRRGSVRVSTEDPTSTSLSPSSPVDRAQNVSREVSKRPMTTKNLENAICSRIGSARYRGVPLEAEFEGVQRTWLRTSPDAHVWRMRYDVVDENFLWGKSLNIVLIT